MRRGGDRLRRQKAGFLAIFAIRSAQLEKLAEEKIVLERQL